MCLAAASHAATPHSCNVILGILSFLFSSAAMLALGFPHWIALGIVAGILEFIPIAGWIMAATSIAGFGVLTHSH